LIAYTLNFRSSRIPGALSGLRLREREEGVSLRERRRRKETERERGIRNGQRVCEREERDRRQIDPYHLIH
jgi:hypothetical protein